MNDIEKAYMKEIQDFMLSEYLILPTISLFVVTYADYEINYLDKTVNICIDIDSKRIHIYIYDNINDKAIQFTTDRNSVTNIEEFKKYINEYMNYPGKM